MSKEISLDISLIAELNRAVDEKIKEVKGEKEHTKVQTKLKEDKQLELDELKEIHDETNDDVVSLRERNSKLEKIVQELKTLMLNTTNSLNNLKPLELSEENKDTESLYNEFINFLRTTFTLSIW